MHIIQDISYLMLIELYDIEIHINMIQELMSF